MISVASLIYKSPSYAQSVYDSIMEYTPMIQRGEAEFYFVANDASKEVIDFLDSLGCKYFKQDNPSKTYSELVKMGIGWPEYIHRVYRGWNRAILEATGEYVCLVNSDHFFSPDWLENLVKYHNDKRIVCSRSVTAANHWRTLFADFGKSLSGFRKKEFLEYVDRKKKDGIMESGVYMPCLFLKQQALAVGLYPEGNIVNEKNCLRVKECGDANFFKKMKEQLGIEHVTSLSSIVYHLYCGEMVDK